MYTCVFFSFFLQCIYLCLLQVLILLNCFRFENIYNARVAFQAYEAQDMKGMFLTEHTLMRTLKVCLAIPNVQCITMVQKVEL